MNRSLLALALLVPAPLFAQAAAPSMTRATFEGRVGTEFGDMDTNKDGVVTKAEIEAWQTKTAAMIAAAQNKAIFEKLDADHNGSLSLTEFRRAGPAPMKANPDALMAEIDANKDGKVTKAEHAAAGAARFTQLDSNKDGVLTAAEARAAAAARQK